MIDRVARISLASLAAFLLFAGSAQALPSLQLGPGSAGTWSYDDATQTWTVEESVFELLAFANAEAADGGNGDYAWDPTGSATQTAYLVASAVPKTNLDSFDITIDNDAFSITLVDSGFGTPPVADPNSLAPHGIFATWFEIYEFEFDGALTGISDTQPGETGTGQGYEEVFDITITRQDGEAVHFDLFTLTGDGIYDSAGGGTVNAFAPFSHDAEAPIPEPGALLVFVAGFLTVELSRRSRTRRA